MVDRQPTPQADEISVGEPVLGGHPFAAVYEEHAPLMRRVALRWRVPPPDVDSVVNEIFLRYLADPGIVRGELRRYFMTAAKYASWDYWRDRDRKEPLDCLPEDAAEINCGLAEQLALRSAVRMALGHLRRGCAEALCLFHIHGKTFKEIAEILDTSPGYAKLKVIRCRKQFRERFLAITHKSQ